MLRLSGLIAVATLLLAAPALAETDWSKYGSFATTRCEDAGTIADIKESLKGLKFNDGGGATFGSASQVRIARSATVKATRNVLICKLTMRTVEGGKDFSYNARFTVTLNGNQWRTLYQPNY
jgi:hypothetical protein